MPPFLGIGRYLVVGGVGGGRKKSWWTSMQCLICWLFFTIKVITKHTLLKSFDWCWYINMYIIWCYITCWMIVIIVYTLDSSTQRSSARLLFIKIINIGYFKFLYHDHWQISNGIWFLKNTSKWIIYFSILYIKLFKTLYAFIFLTSMTSCSQHLFYCLTYIELFFRDV